MVLKYSILLGFFSFIYACSSIQSVPYLEDNSPQTQFAKTQIKKAFLKVEKEELVALKNIQFHLDSVNLAKQAYRIEVDEEVIKVFGGDANGLMYGGLTVAEQIEIAQKVTATEGKPSIERRGIKFNIPLDARTPSYDDSGDAAQKNIGEMWNRAFWTEFLDDMAIHRYNVLTLWNPHPFPSMIKLTDYPDIALDDVMVTTLKPGGRENEWGDPQLVTSNVMANLKKIKTINIEEKIEFWRFVMRYAKSRGIATYFITWNICPNSVAQPVEPFYYTFGVQLPPNEPAGKYGISHQISNPKTKAYFRAATKQFILTYPDLEGIGVTAGEHMPKNDPNYDQEEWLWETYGLGILDAKKEQPNRTVSFIHRIWFSDMDKIMKYWKNYPDPFEVSFKYAKARLYSTPNIPFAEPHIKAMASYGLKSWWNLRNDDIFVYRWGDPDFVRDFLNNFPKETTAAYHMGSDGYVWGREFLSKNKELSGELEIKKHWYKFMLWGRLGYDLNLDKNFFIQKLAAQYPNTDAPKLYTAWQTASKIIPKVNTFHWRDWDHMFAVEGCLTKPKHGGFRTVVHFLDNPTMQGSNMLNPKKFVELSLAKAKIEGISPLIVAANLKNHARETLGLVKELANSTNKTAEYLTLLEDLQAMAYLGLYYAEKIEGAVALGFFNIEKSANYRQSAIEHLELAIDHWTNYTKISTKNYHSQMMARTSLLDWEVLLQEVKKDADLARNWSPKK